MISFFFPFLCPFLAQCDILALAFIARAMSAQGLNAEAKLNRQLTECIQQLQADNDGLRACHTEEGSVVASSLFAQREKMP